MSRQYYYPPGTSPQSGPHCGYVSEYKGDYIYDNGKCKLLPNHEGPHSIEANWNAHVEVVVTDYGLTEVAFRSWHDSRGLSVRNRAEADALLKFFGDVFDEQWPSE